MLTAVPLYILMSQILLTGKVGNDLFELGNKWLRHLPGGLGVATVFACAIFAAITGSSVACAVTIGAIAIPEMLSRGYERTLVLGAVNNHSNKQQCQNNPRYNAGHKQLTYRFTSNSAIQNHWYRWRDQNA